MELSVLEVLVFLAFPLAMAFAGSMDLFTMTIPNRISLALIAAFVVAAPYCGLTVTQIAWHLGCGFLMLVIGILMFSRGWLGGGDAKLLAAASLWLGFEHLLGYLVLVAVAGGMLASTIMLYRSMTIPLCLIGQGWASRLHEKTSGIPYGIALAAAALWIYPSTTWFKVLVA